MKKQRLFVGIDLSKKTKLQFSTITQQLATAYPDITWVQEDSFHVTLKFLGVTTTTSELITKALQKKLHGIRPFPLIFAGLAVWVKDTTVNLVWEIEKNEPLMQVYFMINNCLESWGFPRERRAFTPHITLGKRRTKDSSIPLTVFPSLPASISVNHITLFESKWKPVHYIVRGIVSLQSV